MFWKNKNKLPISSEDRVWVDEDLNWLCNSFGEEHVMTIKTVTPTKNFYNRVFDGTENDAEFILKRTMELMSIHDVEIQLSYFSDSPTLASDGSILSTPADMYGSWESASGTYQQRGDEIIISVERGQLSDPISLIATISHELAHQILLGENRIEENDEFLTDLTAIFYGFGIFLGNSRFNMSSNIEGWQSRGQGYLPEQIIAYAMAWLSFKRNENTDYTKYLKKSLAKYFNRSLEWLKTNQTKK